MEPAQFVHDPYNERLKIYGAKPDSLDPACVTEANVGKVTVYALPGEADSWEELGFQKEAVIRGFYEDEDAHLWAAYTEEARACSERESLHQTNVAIAVAKPVSPEVKLPGGFHCEVAAAEDSLEIADLMGNTFTDYPTPISSELIEHQIRNQLNHFRLVRDKAGQVAAVASAELDHERASAEMTDCATRPEDRGRGLMGYLLDRIASDIGEVYEIRDLYTLARADEVGMNCVFSKLGYDFCGRLVNNCRMPNGWESMNVWCKSN